MNNFKKFYEEKKSIVLSIIAIITLLTLIIGATYAYFQASIGSSGNIDVGVETGDVDTLTFIAEDKIEFDVNVTNFGQGAGNVGDTATAKAQLIASRALQNETRFAEEDYNVFLVITENDFEYTTDSGEMELRLQVTDPNGNKVTSITGLNYITTDKEGNALEESEQGFDITTRTGSFLIAADWDIRTNDILVQDWLIDVTMINLDSNQNKNAGKTFNGEILMQNVGKATYEVLEINNLVDTTTTYNSITTTLDVKDGTEVANKYYFGIEEVTEPIAMIGSNILRLSNNLIAGIEEVNFIESNSATYTYSNLKANTIYKIYGYAIDKYKIKSNVYETEIRTGEYEIPVIESVEESKTLNTITVSVNATSGDGEIVKYLYSINDEEYMESELSSYTFENLQDTSEYKIKIKVKDENEVYSTEWIKNINTEVYVLPSITKVDSSSTYNSITLTTDALKGKEEISKYWYSIDGEEFVEWSSSKTFNGLEESKEYNFKIKVSDINERYSEEYSLSASTVAYVLPKVTNVEVTATSSTLTVKATASNGDGNVVNYYFSKNNGSDWESNTTGTYVFEKLTSEATYNIKVYVEDNNGRISSEYVTSGTTSKIVVTPVVASSTNASNGWYKEVSISASVNATTDSPTIKHCTTSATTCDATSSYGGAVTLSENASARRICFQATDIEGNTSDIACSDAYKVDATAGNATFSISSSTGPINGWYQALTIGITGSDTQSGVTSMKYCGGVSCTPSTTTNSSSASQSLTNNASAQQVCAIVTNGAGMTSEKICSSEYKVDGEAPSVTSPSGNSDGIITFTASDNHSGVDTYCVNQKATDTTGCTWYTATSGKNTSGEIITTSGNYYVHLKDKAGNVGNSSSFNVTITVLLADYIIDSYESDGTNNLYLHDGEGTYTNANLEAGDNSYRYTGSYENVNNYVCFGSDATTCPDENLYRIIGVFNNNGEEQVKLIKWDFATTDMLGTAQATGYTYSNGVYKGALTTIPGYYWSGSNSNQSNTWSSSTLNKTALNTNYMTYLGNDWTEMIATTTWKVGGNTFQNIQLSNAKTAYINEIVNPAENTTYQDEIGLMYVSDYMYAASPAYWSYKGSDTATTDYRAAMNENWMLSWVHEWTITRSSNDTSRAFDIVSSGYIGRVGIDGSAGVRPVFNLKSSVVWMGGDGSKNLPYRIGI
ncbi:MAG: fibronectin type III domain-containing protein [Firmicutes bacterium]|nr:fibronectin type III domain-containing protein [Bacillota bacterium]